MKARIEFEADLYRRLNAAATLRGMKVGELVNDAVRAYIQSSPQTFAELPLIGTLRKNPLSIPDDIVSRLDFQSPPG